MPDLIPVFDLEKFEQDALDVLVAQWRAKRPRNSLRAAFYEMKNSSRSLKGKNVPAIIQKRDFVLGWSASAVDKLNRRVNFDGFYDAAGNDLASLGLEELSRQNRLVNEVSQAGSSALIHAVSWLVTTQGDTSAGEPKVLVNARSAMSGTGVWDGRLRKLSSFLGINAFDDKGEPTSMTLMLPNLNVFIDRAGSQWVVRRRAHRYGVPVDPMVYRPRVERPFGSSRITRAAMSYHLQALSAMIRADVNGEAYSLARYILLGATEEAFKNADGSPKSTWQAAWDAVWAIGDDPNPPPGSSPRADVKQFSGQSPEPQHAHLRMLAQMFSGETGIPLGELGIIGDSNPTSAEALLTSRDDLIAEAGRTADDFAPDLSSVAHRVLEMSGESLPSNLDIRPRFRDPVTVSRAQAADAGAKVIDTLPWLAETTVGLELLGLTPDQARRAVAERQRSQGRATLERLAGGSGDNA